MLRGDFYPVNKCFANNRLPIVLEASVYRRRVICLLRSIKTSLLVGAVVFPADVTPPENSDAARHDARVHTHTNTPARAPATPAHYADVVTPAP